MPNEQNEPTVAEKPKEDTTLALKDASGKIVSYDYGEDAGGGLQYASLGARIPFLSVVSSMSKAIVPGHEKFVKGAQIGSLLVSGSNEVFDGNTGVEFVGICEQHVFVEKTALDHSGKFVAQYQPDDPVVLEARRAEKDRASLRTKAGNVLVEVFRMYGVIVENTTLPLSQWKIKPVVLGFERTKLKARRSIMEKINTHKSKFPLWALKLRVKTGMDQGKKGDFANFRIDFLNGDLLNSLISPTSDGWAKWTAECRRARDMVANNTISADIGSEHTDDETGEDGGPAPF